MARSVLTCKQDYNSLPVGRENCIAEVNEDLYKETIDSRTNGKQNEEVNDIEDLIIGIQRKKKQESAIDAGKDHQDIC